MLGMNVSKKENDLIVKWQLSKTNIPINEITSIKLDDTYGGENKEAVRIGTPYGTTDRLVIETNKQNYILFTTDIHSIIRKVETYSGMSVSNVQK